MKNNHSKDGFRDQTITLCSLKHKLELFYFPISCIRPQTVSMICGHTVRVGGFIDSQLVFIPDILCV